MNQTEKALALAKSDRLNCIAELDETALEQAKAQEADKEGKPLAGVPVLVKDNIDVKGLHTTAGSLALADNIAREDAPVIRNLRRNGAVILGGRVQLPGRAGDSRGESEAFTHRFFLRIGGGGCSGNCTDGCGNGYLPLRDRLRDVQRDLRAETAGGHTVGGRDHSHCQDVGQRRGDGAEPDRRTETVFRHAGRTAAGTEAP